MKNALRDVVDEALLRRQLWAGKKKRFEPLWPGGPTGSEYLKGFVRRPGMGSYALYRLGKEDQPGVYEDQWSELESTGDVAMLFRYCQYEDVTDTLPTAVKRPGCRYYRGTPKTNWPRPEFQLWQDVVPLTSFAVTQDEADADTFRNRALYVVEGPHGLELRAANRNEPVLVDHITVITDDDGLVTWHPGYPAAPIDFVNAVVKYT